MNGRGQNSRIYWALARDNAVPFSSFFSKVSERLSCPVPATVFVGKSLHVFLTTILYIPRSSAKDVLLTDQRTESTKKQPSSLPASAPSPSAAPPRSST